MDVVGKSSRVVFYILLLFPLLRSESFLITVCAKSNEQITLQKKKLHLETFFFAIIIIVTSKKGGDGGNKHKRNSRMHKVESLRD
jgi:hypothetical protein